MKYIYWRSECYFKDKVVVCIAEGLLENEIKGRKELSIPYAMEFKLSGNLQRTKWSSITSYRRWYS